MLISTVPSLLFPVLSTCDCNFFIGHCEHLKITSRETSHSSPINKLFRVPETLTTRAVEFIPIFHQLWAFGPCCWYIISVFTKRMITHLVQLLWEFSERQWSFLISRRYASSPHWCSKQQIETKIWYVLCFCSARKAKHSPFHVHQAFVTHSAHSSLRCDSQTSTTSFSVLIFPEGRLVHTVDLRDHSSSCLMHDKYSW